MGYSDIIWMAVVISWTLFLLYRSICKKKGHCQGCSSEMCGLKKEKDDGC